jgi:hypothetical protein
VPVERRDSSTDKQGQTRVWPLRNLATTAGIPDESGDFDPILVTPILLQPLRISAAGSTPCKTPDDPAWGGKARLCLCHTPNTGSAFRPGPLPVLDRH